MKFKSIFPPVCVHGPVSNKWYVITDGIWHEVSRAFSWPELEAMWDRVIMPKKEIPMKKTKKEWIVDGSKGNKYRITGYGGYWSCSCPAHAFGRGKDCKHITQIKSKL